MRSFVFALCALVLGTNALAQGVPPTVSGDGSAAGTGRNGRCYAWAAPANAAGTSFVFTWLGASSAQGTATNQSTLPGSTRTYVQWASGAVSGNVGGLQGSAQMTPRYQAGIIWSIGIRQDTITARRDFFGMSTSITANAAPANGPDALASHQALIAFDPAVSAQYRCCTTDGTNRTCSDIPGATAEVTEYTLSVDYMTAGTVTCSVRKISTGVTWSLPKTTNLPSRAVGTASVYSEAKAFTQEAAAKNFQAAWIAAEWSC